MASQDTKVLRVGIIGAGEVAQVIHLPTLSLLSHLYTISAISDISPAAVKHCSTKFHIPLSTTDPYSLIANPDLDIIFVLTSDQYHEPYTVAALKAGKHVMLEKPLALSMQAGLSIVQAEKESGKQVFVGTMRRYAPSFVGAFKKEMEGLGRILYARSRGIIGPNPHFVAQSGAFGIRFGDDIPSGVMEEGKTKLDEVLAQTLGADGLTEEKVEYWRFLGSLGSHDLSLMREAIGFPEAVAGVSVNAPFYTAIFDYRNKTGEPFSCTYETGIDGVPRFDSHLAIYGENKAIIIQYDTPYVKGLPIRVKVEELVNGEAVTREILTSFEDAYTAEFKEMHKCFTEGQTIKTSAEDALLDLKLWGMMLEKYEEKATATKGAT